MLFNEYYFCLNRVVVVSSLFDEFIEAYDQIYHAKDREKLNLIQSVDYR